MGDNDLGITEKEFIDSIKSSVIFLEEALKQDDKELRKRIEGLVELYNEMDIEELFK